MFVTIDQMVIGGQDGRHCGHADVRWTGEGSASDEPAGHAVSRHR
jgi:hypothetical protein